MGEGGGGGGAWRFFCSTCLSGRDGGCRGSGCREELRRWRRAARQAGVHLPAPPAAPARWSGGAAGWVAGSPGLGAWAGGCVWRGVAGRGDGTPRGCGWRAGVSGKMFGEGQAGGLALEDAARPCVPAGLYSCRGARAGAGGAARFAKTGPPAPYLGLKMSSRRAVPFRLAFLLAAFVGRRCKQGLGCTLRATS